MTKKEKFLTGFRANLAGQLPEGCELLSVSVAKAKAAVRPCQATYVLAVRRSALRRINEELKTNIERLLASESLFVKRDTRCKIRDTKVVDVRSFIKSIEFDNNGNIAVEGKISSAGSIRPFEILKLLELDVEKLATPINRTNVQWEVSE